MLAEKFFLLLEHSEVDHKPHIVISTARTSRSNCRAGRKPVQKLLTKGGPFLECIHHAAHLPDADLVLHPIRADWHNSDIPARTPDVCFRG